MKKLFLVLVVILTVSLLVVAHALWGNPLSELTASENYTVLKREDSRGFLGREVCRKFLLRVDNLEQFEKDCLQFFSMEGESGDAYVYCSSFSEDASEFSAEYKDAQFSSASLRLCKDYDWKVIWRCLFSEDKKYCYIHILDNGY